MAEPVVIRPRIGVPQPKRDPVAETFEKTLDDAPKTKEEETAVKRSTSWEWIIWVVGGIVLVLIIIWFIYPYFIKGDVKPDEVKAAVTDCKAPAPATAAVEDPTPKPSQASNDLYKAYADKKKSKTTKKATPPEGESPDQPEQPAEQPVPEQPTEQPAPEQSAEQSATESTEDKVAGKIAKNLEN